MGVQLRSELFKGTSDMHFLKAYRSSFGCVLFWKDKYASLS